ncbi:MAG TPA: hypothetical protein VHU84_06820, partial [Lacipirellulaceae bacterium]|nr:hypothetical protein [Lacipirellulaceae bacterium]
MSTWQFRLLVGSLLVACGQSAFGYVTYGNGYGSKWGDDPSFGTGAIVTWSFMQDGTTVDPSVPDASGMSGTSNVTALRASVDSVYGSGAFNTAIQNALNTWSAAANITFVGPVPDSGLPSGSVGAANPNIRIGAFHAVANSGFAGVGAIGYGPPGPPNDITDFPLSGDVFFNLDGPGTVRSFQIAPG